MKKAYKQALGLLGVLLVAVFLYNNGNGVPLPNGNGRMLGVNFSVDWYVKHWNTDDKPWNVYSSNNQLKYIREWGFNSVTIVLKRKISTEEFPYTVEGVLPFTWIDGLVEETAKLGMPLVLRYSSDSHGYWEKDWWHWMTDKAIWRNDWIQIVSRYTTYNHVYYNLYGEPWGQPTIQEWHDTFQDMIGIIEDINPNAKFSIEPLIGGNRGCFYGSMKSALDMPLNTKNDLIYEPHMYVKRLKWDEIEGNYTDIRKFVRDSLLWDEALSRGYKINIGEFGVGGGASANAEDWYKPMWQITNELGISYHVWWWATYGDSALLKDWTGNPLEGYGVFVKEQLG